MRRWNVSIPRGFELNLKNIVLAFLLYYKSVSLKKLHYLKMTHETWFKIITLSWFYNTVVITLDQKFLAKCLPDITRDKRGGWLKCSHFYQWRHKITIKCAPQGVKIKCPLQSIPPFRKQCGEVRGILSLQLGINFLET